MICNHLVGCAMSFGAYVSATLTRPRFWYPFVFSRHQGSTKIEGSSEGLLHWASTSSNALLCFCLSRTQNISSISSYRKVAVAFYGASLGSPTGTLPVVCSCSCDVLPKPCPENNSFGVDRILYAWTRLNHKHKKN